MDDECLDNVKDDCNEVPRADWLSLFNSTSKTHAPSLSLAVILSVASGIVIPALAVFLGKLFDAFTSYGAKQISGPHLNGEVSAYGICLVTLGCVSGTLNAIYFMSWLIFGELQAKNAREEQFHSMLDKDMEWYDTRKPGIETLISRLQM